MRSHKGQSTVEYMLLVSAVLVILILFMTGQNQGGFQYRLNKVFNETTQDMANMVTYLSVNAATN